MTLLRVRTGIATRFAHLSVQSRLILIYTLCSCLSVSALFADLYIHSKLGTSYYFLSYTSVLLNTAIGGMTAGFLTTTICAAGVLGISIFTTGITPLQFPAVFETCMYLATSILGVTVIEKFRETDVRIAHHKKEHEMRNKIESLEKILTNAKQEIKARDEFLSIASHELKTPLTSMLLGIQSLLHSIKNVSLANFSVANLLEKLESTEHQSKRLSRMINDLLNLSLITTGRMELQTEDIDLSELTKETVTRLSEKLKKDNCTVELKTDGEVKGRWDKIRLEQVITNLVTNAAKYGQGNPIEIRVTKSKGQAYITVEDHGMGIPSEQQKKIFQRFVRADGTARSIEGLGVGLYISKMIVDAHKGSIAVSSKQGKGSTFSIVLPLRTG